MCVKILNGYLCNFIIDLYGIYCKKVNYWFYSLWKGVIENVVI